jgi:NAD(P)-dependent dehydrogenase (short-subunit alcohol dehydrogenase family)
MPGFGVLSTVLLGQPGGPETMRLRQPAAAAELVVATEQALGPVDILIANARIGRVRPLEEVSVAEFDETVAVNGKTLRGSARQGHQLHLLPAWSSRPMPGTPSATTPASWSTAAPTTCWSSRPTSQPARPAGRPAVADHPGHGPHPRSWPRAHRAADPEGRRRRGLCFPRRPGDPGHPPRPRAGQPPLAHRHRVRRHQPGPGQRQPRPAGRLAAWALAD